MTEQERERAASPAYKARLEAEASKLYGRRVKLIAGGFETAAALVSKRLAAIDKEIERHEQAAAS